MGLDIYLEADKRLSLVQLAEAVTAVGADELDRQEASLEAGFPSGLFLRARHERDDPAIRAEEASSLMFSVVTRGYLRIGRHSPEGADPLGDIKNLVEQLAARSDAHFVVSFQYESLLYYRDHEGLHTV